MPGFAVGNSNRDIVSYDPAERSRWTSEDENVAHFSETIREALSSRLMPRDELGGPNAYKAAFKCCVMSWLARMSACGSLILCIRESGARPDFFDRDLLPEVSIEIPKETLCTGGFEAHLLVNVAGNACGLDSRTQRCCTFAGVIYEVQTQGQRQPNYASPRLLR